MAWKNLKQQSLASVMIVEHDAIKELDELNELIDWSRVEEHLLHISCQTIWRKSLATTHDVQSTVVAELV